MSATEKKKGWQSHMSHIIKPSGTNGEMLSSITNVIFVAMDALVVKIYEDDLIAREV